MLGIKLEHQRRHWCNGALYGKRQADVRAIVNVGVVVVEFRVAVARACL
jgi:hypothetical protein